MIKEDTVFILGAGASWPYGLPTSEELRIKICQNFADRIKNLVEARAPDKAERMYKEALEFTDAFYGSSDSIDLWLMNNKRFITIGKHAIITYILQGESNGNLRERSPHPEQDWYTHLWKKMKDDSKVIQNFESFSSNNIDFITFNYDRSLEHFLIGCIANRFYTHNISEKEIIDQFNTRKIIHIYGKIAPLNWQSKRKFLPYGHNPENMWLAEYTNNIKIIEEAEKTKEVEDAVSLIKKAKRIFFLGFGYAQENLKILDIPKILNRSTKIFGTAIGLNEEERKDKINLITTPSTPQALFNNKNIRMEPVDCLELLKKHL